MIFKSQAWEPNLFFRYIYFVMLCVWVFYLYICLCTTCNPGACRALELSGLETQMKCFELNWGAHKSNKCS